MKENSDIVLAKELHKPVIKKIYKKTNIYNFN